MHGDVCEIIPGFFIGSAADAEEMVRRGVDVIVQLAWEDESIREAGFRGLLHFAYIEDGGIITDSELYRLVEEICGQLNRGRKVGMYCAGGHGRTGYVAACVLAEKGIRDPIGYLRSHYSPKAVETEVQAAAVFRYVKMTRELEGLIADEIGTDGGRGFCTLYWLTKKRILKERYGIDWKSPADIYKGVIFD